MILLPLHYFCLVLPCSLLLTHISFPLSAKTACNRSPVLLLSFSLEYCKEASGVGFVQETPCLGEGESFFRPSFRISLHPKRTLTITFISLGFCFFFSVCYMQTKSPQFEREERRKGGREGERKRKKKKKTL